MQQPRNYADPAKTVYIPAGALKFGIEFRHLRGDQGICIHVFGEVNGQEEPAGPKPCRPRTGCSRAFDTREGCLIP